MRTMNGFVKLHRRLLEWGWYQDSVVKSVFLHLILTASYKDCEWMGITIRKGQVVVGIQKLADELGLTRQQVRTAINKLKSTNEITTEATNQFTLITLVKWEEYQSDGETATNGLTNNPTNGQPSDNQRITNEQPHIKNIENIKNNKKEREEGAEQSTAENTHSLCVNKFIPPSADEVKAYCAERGNAIDAERFVDYYTARSWSKISDWRAAVRAWEKTEREKDKPAAKSKFCNFEQKPMDYEAVKQRNLQRLLDKWG